MAHNNWNTPSFGTQPKRAAPFPPSPSKTSHGAVPRRNKNNFTGFSSPSPPPVNDRNPFGQNKIKTSHGATLKKEKTASDSKGVFGSSKAKVSNIFGSRKTKNNNATSNNNFQQNASNNENNFTSKPFGNNNSPAKGFKSPVATQNNSFNKSGLNSSFNKNNKNGFNKPAFGASKFSSPPSNNNNGSGTNNNNFSSNSGNKKPYQNNGFSKPSFGGNTGTSFGGNNNSAPDMSARPKMALNLQAEIQNTGASKPETYGGNKATKTKKMKGMLSSARKRITKQASRLTEIKNKTPNILKRKTKNNNATDFETDNETENHLEMVPRAKPRFKQNPGFANNNERSPGLNNQNFSSANNTQSNNSPFSAPSTFGASQPTSPPNNSFGGSKFNSNSNTVASRNNNQTGFTSPFSKKNKNGFSSPFSKPSQNQNNSNNFSASSNNSKPVGNQFNPNLNRQLPIRPDSDETTSEISDLQQGSNFKSSNPFTSPQGGNRNLGGGQANKRTTNNGFQKRSTNNGFQKTSTNNGFQKRSTNNGFQKRATNNGFQNRNTNNGFMAKKSSFQRKTNNSFQDTKTHGSSNSLYQKPAVKRNDFYGKSGNVKSKANTLFSSSKKKDISKAPGTTFKGAGSVKAKANDLFGSNKNLTSSSKAPASKPIDMGFSKSGNVSSKANDLFGSPGTGFNARPPPSSHNHFKAPNQSSGISQINNTSGFGFSNNNNNTSFGQPTGGNDFNEQKSAMNNPFAAPTASPPRFQPAKPKNTPPPKAMTSKPASNGGNGFNGNLNNLLAGGRKPRRQQQNTVEEVPLERAPRLALNLQAEIQKVGGSGAAPAKVGKKKIGKPKKSFKAKPKMKPVQRNIAAAKPSVPKRNFGAKAAAVPFKQREQPKPPVANMQRSNPFASPPSNAFSQPTNDFSQPANAFSHPTNAFSQPANAFSQPANDFSQLNNNFNNNPTTQNGFGSPANPFATSQPAKTSSFTQVNDFRAPSPPVTKQAPKFQAMNITQPPTSKPMPPKPKKRLPGFTRSKPPPPKNTLPSKPIARQQIIDPRISKVVNETQKQRLRESIKGLKKLASFWDEVGTKNKKKQELNPFSDHFAGKREIAADNIMESKSDERAAQAKEWTNKEVDRVVQVIKDFGTFNSSTNQTTITFGELFIIYEQISNTLVFMLLKARKRNKLFFDNEKHMLLQGRDDQVIISVNH